MMFAQDHILAFVETWEELDVAGEGFIDAHSLTTLLVAVPPPMGVKGQDHVSMRVQDIIMEVEIPFR